MRIRRAVENDASALSALVLAAKRYWGYADAQMAAWRAGLEITTAHLATYPAYVGEHEGRIVGFYSLVPSDTAWELDNLWVLPEFNRKGFGRALLAHATLTAASSGATVISIDADPHAETFYLACGAHRAGAVAAPIAGHAHRVRPQLELPVRKS